MQMIATSSEALDGSEVLIMMPRRPVSSKMLGQPVQLVTQGRCVSTLRCSRECMALPGPQEEKSAPPPSRYVTCRRHQCVRT